MRFRNSLIGLVGAVVVLAMTVSTVAAAPPPKPAKTIAFTDASYQVSQGSPASISLTRSDSHGPASVTFATSDHTASAGTNYTSVSTTVDFKSGQSTASVSVPTTPVAALASSGVTVTLTLSAPSRKYSLGSLTEATLTIYPLPAPSAPTDLSATLVTGFQIPHVALSWTASATGTVDHYTIYVATSPGGPYGTLGEATSVSYDVAPAPTVTTYYVVEAVDASGQSSGYSNEASAAPMLYGSGLYWANFSNGTIMAANPDGTGVRALVTGQSNPFGVAVGASYIYWANDVTAGTINRANLDGSGVTTLVTDQANPYGVAVDATHIYWADYSSGTIMQSDLNGANVTRLASGENSPSAVAVAGSTLFWTDTASNRIRELDLASSTGATTLLSGLGDHPFALAADATHLYWAITGSNEGSDGTIMSASLDGTGVATLASGQAHPDGIAVSAGTLYWANANDGTIVRADLDGSNATTLTSGQDLPAGVAVG